MLLAIVISGFLLALVAPALTRVLGRAAGWAFAVLPASIALWLVLQVPAVSSGEILTVSYPWIEALGIELAFMLDGLSLLFALLISAIGALILVYAGGYLAGHPHQGRLFGFLLFFMGSMLGVAFSSNLMALFVFWELTSISSYLLIGFDHRRPQARAAALQALLVTGLGGLALLAGVILVGMASGTYSIPELLANPEVLRSHALYVPIVILFCLGCFTKSAQFPFHFWLPGAMEAPTPISAYLHSSTMVKAGIYLLARMTPVLGQTDLWQILLVSAGGATMAIGAFLALRESYLKRLLAYSTVSALGTITLGLGVGSVAAIEAAMAFLFAHALYKGALFMVAGAIDHETGEKNVDKLSGLRASMPILAIVATAAAASLAGLPPMAGFVGKELMLKGLLESPIAPELIAALLTISAAMLFVVAFLVAIKPFYGPHRPTPKKPHDPPHSMLLGPGVLALFSVLVAILPGTLAEPLLGPAASAILQDESHPHLHLWHGWTLALLLSFVAIATGFALIVLRRRWIKHVPSLAFIDRFSPSAAYTGTLNALAVLATSQTRALQHGSLRGYMVVTLAATVGMVGYPLITKVGFPVITQPVDLHWYELGLGMLILLSSIAAVTAKGRLMAIITLGLVGMGVTMFYVLYSAPDLALTQVSIEALSVVLFVLVFRRLPDFRKLSGKGSKLRDVAIAVTGGALMSMLVLMATSFETDNIVSRELAERSYPEAFGRNVVNVIIVDFRALDTLGEITVLAIAALGVFSLLKLRPTEASA